MTACVCVSANVCAHAFTCTLSPLRLVGRNAASHLSINIMFQLAGFAGFSAAVFSEAGGHRTDVCVHVVTCVHLIHGACSV